MQKINVEKEKFNNILRLITENAHDGLEQFYEEYGRLIYWSARSKGCSHEKANVVVNTVLIKIWKKASQIRDIENPRAWISTVAKNCAKDERKKFLHLELKEGTCASKDEIQKIIDQNGFEYLLGPLKDEEKDLFILKFTMGCTFQDIADTFEKPLPTVTTIYYRALEKLRNFLKHEKTE